nr:hypothetical protein [Tanacetum cinerariifolium]
ENSEDIFGFGSSLEDFICVAFVPVRNIFGISGLLHHVVTTIADRIRERQWYFTVSAKSFKVLFKIVAYDKNFSSIWSYMLMMLPRVRNHHGGKRVLWGSQVNFQGKVVYTTLLSMVCEVICIREENCC